MEASLRPGANLGQSVLVVRVIEAKSLSGLIGVDNYSPPSVGSVRLGGALSYRNITGYGDEIGLTYYRTTAGVPTRSIWSIAFPSRRKTARCSFGLRPIGTA